MDQEEVNGESIGEYVDSEGDDLPAGMKSGIVSIIKDVQIGGVGIERKNYRRKLMFFCKKMPMDLISQKMERLKYSIRFWNMLMLVFLKERLWEQGI